MKNRLVTLVIALAIAMAVAACGDDGPAAESPSTTEAGGVDSVIELEIVDEKLVGGVRRDSVTQGDTVRLVVTGDSTDEIHVHGYDLYVELDSGDGELTFDALIPGRFEIELEGSGQLLIELEVAP